ncbi:hypothetical protein AAC387_Pa01g4073 [Persea americana]
MRPKPSLPIEGASNHKGGSFAPRGFLKFNVDGAARKKPGPAGVEGVLAYILQGNVLLMFSKKVGIKESNETEVLAILEALRLFFSSFREKLLAESDSSNEGPWRFHFLSAEIKSLSSQGYVEFRHVRRLANAMADSIAKQGVDRVTPLIAYTM